MNEVVVYNIFKNYDRLKNMIINNKERDKKRKDCNIEILKRGVNLSGKIGCFHSTRDLHDGYAYYIFVNRNYKKHPNIGCG